MNELSDYDEYEALARREEEREHLLEQAWDEVCCEEAVIEADDPVFGGKIKTRAFCVADKNHGRDAHLFSTKTWLTPNEIIQQALSFYAQRPF